MSSDGYVVVRGARILQVMLEQSTATDLEANIERGFPETRKRQHATGPVQISNVTFVPYVGMKFLHAKSIATSNGTQYTPSIQFLRVDFEGADTSDNITFTAADGEDYHVKPIALHEHNVKVKCNCMDFHYRFAHHNSQDRSLIGRPPAPYQRKTVTRPPANPLQVPGMCKHVIKLIHTLQERGLVLY